LAGRINKVAVTVGQEVDKGTLLVELEAQELALAVRQGGWELGQVLYFDFLSGKTPEPAGWLAHGSAGPGRCGALL